MPDPAARLLASTVIEALAAPDTLSFAQLASQLTGDEASPERRPLGSLL